MVSDKKIVLFYGKTEEERDWHWMPINMVFLASSLVKDNYEVVIIDERVNPDYQDYLIKILSQVLFFGISSFSGYQIKSSLKAANIVRKYRPDLPIVWGGTHPSSLPQQTLKDARVDIIVRGQGEKALQQIIKAFESKTDLSNIAGLTYEKDGKIISNPSKRFDINKLPRLPFELLDIGKYINPKTRALNYTTSVGCSGYCSFCFWESKNSNDWQFFDIERVLDDMEFFVKKYNLKIIKFMDANFVVSQDRIVELCEGILRRKLKFNWNAEGRVDEFIKFSDETIKLMESAGLNSIFIGLESVSPRILKLMNKKITPDDAMDLVIKSNKFSFKLLFSLMFGLPTETLEDLRITADFIAKSLQYNPKIHYQRCVFAPYPSTSLFYLAKQHGYRPPETLEGWQDFYVQEGSFIEVPAWFSRDFFEKYRTQFYESFPDPGNYLKHLIVD